MIESNIVSLFVFSIRDACCKGVDNWVAKKVMFNSISSGVSREE